MDVTSLTECLESLESTAKAAGGLATLWDCAGNTTEEDEKILAAITVLCDRVEHITSAIRKQVEFHSEP
jgi:hypothetical protein